MADSIKIGSLDINAFKVGSGNCKVYLGDTLLYPKMNFRLKRYFIDGRSNEFTCNSSSAVTSADTRSGYTVAQLTATTSGLSKVEIGDCTSVISSNTFNAMTQLSSITFSDSVKTVAASGCQITQTASNNRLHDINLGKIETIGDYAFLYCGKAYTANQPKIKFPNTLTNIGKYAFQAGNFNELTFENGGNLIIGNYCFSGASSYSGISISTNSITELGRSAFCYFRGLTSVSLSGVTGLNKNGFQFATTEELESLEIIGDGNLTIPKYFVGGDSLTAVTLGGITSISNAYGLGSGKTSASVRSLTMLDATPPTIGSSSISDYNPTVIYVPSSAVDAYKTAWSIYKSKIQAIPNS